MVDTIYHSGKITLDAINQKWVQNDISEGNPIPKRTFHNHRTSIEEMFDINIGCNTSTYEYFIENTEDIERGGVRRWLINAFAVNNMLNESHKLKQRILFEDIPSGQQYLTTIIEAMRDGLKLKMHYQGYWMTNDAEFDIQPYFVKVFKQRWYIIGMSDKLRIYALDRIQQLTSTTHKFKMPPNFDPEAYFHDCYGIISGDKSVAQTVKIKITSSQANYLRALPLHHSQKELETTKDYSIFTFYIKPTFDFRQEILSLGDDVEVLLPLSFRTEIEKVILSMNNKYQLTGL